MSDAPRAEECGVHNASSAFVLVHDPHRDPAIRWLEDKGPLTRREQSMDMRPPPPNQH